MFAWLVGLTCRECGASYYREDGYNSNFCSFDCKWEYDERKRERRERKEEKRRAREERQNKDNNKIKSEIESFKETSRRQIGNKYGVEISFSKADVNIKSNSNGKLTHLKDAITQLDNENKNIENLIADFQRAKNEV